MLFSTIFVVLFSVCQVHSIVLLRGEVVANDDSFSNDSLENTVLEIKIEDVSLQDIASVVLSERVIRLGPGKTFPVYFEIVYPKVVLESNDPDHFFAISARIVNRQNQDLLYITDEQHQLPRDGDIENLVTLKVIKIKENSLFDRNACNLPSETGVCLAYFEKFYFDSASQSCKQFVYGGCGGNLNRFDSEEDCLSNCLPKENKPADVAEPKPSVEVCSLEKEVGPCKASFQRYYYDNTQNKCVEFVYGGCRGNANNFRSLEACAKSCYTKI